MRHFVVFTAVLAVLLLAAPCVAAEPEVTCIGQEACHYALDENALIQNVTERLTKVMQLRKPDQPPFPKENLRILGQVPFRIGDTPFVAVKLEVTPVENGQKPGIDYLVVDPSGSVNFQIVEVLGSGRDLSFRAMASLKRETLPEGFGKVAIRGTGKADIIMVSDPICPWCRKAFEFFMAHSDQMATLKLVHYPLASHEGADAACQLIIWCEAQGVQPEEVIRFAYTELKPFRKGGGDPKLVQERARKEILAQFLERFPVLKEKLGADPDAALARLNTETEAVLKADVEAATGRGYDSTPVIFINRVQINGFSQGEIEAALEMVDNGEL